MNKKEKKGPSEHTTAILTCCIPRQDDLAFFKSRVNELYQVFYGSPGRVLIVEKRKAEAPAEAGGSGERSRWSVLWAPSRLSRRRDSILPQDTPSRRQALSNELDASNSGSSMDPAARRPSSGSIARSGPSRLLVQAKGEALNSLRSNISGFSHIYPFIQPVFFQGTNWQVGAFSRR